MTKYASCLKIRADTRILNGAWQDIFCNKNIRVPAIGEELLARHHELEFLKRSGCGSKEPFETGFFIPEECVW